MRWVMGELEITYRYSRLPHQCSNFHFEPRHCDICGVVRRAYARAPSGESEATDGIQYICDQCLAGGALVGRGLEMNEGDIGSLRNQVSALHPDSSTDDIEAPARQRTVEVEQRA